jgi:hypothetical protein
MRKDDIYNSMNKKQIDWVIRHREGIYKKGGNVDT